MTKAGICLKIVFTCLKAGADLKTGKMLILIWNNALSFAPTFKSGLRELQRTSAHPRPLKKERRLREPKDEMLMKDELMAKAGILSEIIITSLKVGAKI